MVVGARQAALGISDSANFSVNTESWGKKTTNWNATLNHITRKASGNVQHVTLRGGQVTNAENHI